MESTATATSTHDGPAYSIKKGATFWFTGLSGAGKSTLSEAVKKQLDSMVGDSRKCFILDGDVIRRGLNKDLGFTAEDRAENIRRISEVAKLFAMSGQICFVAFISPYSKDRAFGRQIHKDSDIPFYECFINASLEECERRDVKGLYKKARAGEIKNFTGISDPYEAPEHPELDVRTDQLSLEQSVSLILKTLNDDGIIESNTKPRVVESLVERLSEDELATFKTLKSIDIEVEQAEYLQTIGQGWAFPLQKFMDEL